MGSWDETCMITQLPITPGDLVKLFIIRWSPLKARLFNGGVYHTDTCEPISGPIECKYNDYGRYEPVEEDKNFAQFVTESICPHVVERDWGENSCHDLPTWKKDLVGKDAYHNMINIIQENRLLVQETILSENRQTGVAMVAIHKDIFDAITSDEYIESLSRWTRSYYRLLSEEQEKYREYLERLKEELALENSSLSEENKAIKRFEIIQKKELLRDILAPNWDINHFKKKLSELDEKTAYHYLDKFAQLDCFNNRLRVSRHQWIPQCGHGSQTIEYKANQFIFQKASELVDKIIEKEDLYGLYEDDDE
jgi:hypothetical protein